MEELPDSLDETYERMLREIRKSNQGHARRMLQCLVAAVRPLRVAELAEVLAVDFTGEGIPILNPGWRWEDHEEAVMSTCSSLVIIVDDKAKDSRMVQFSHFSVKEFLTSDRLAESSREVTVSRYHIELEPAHTVLAQVCLGVLLRLDYGINRDNIKDFPLAEYAAEHWPDHARFENVSSFITGEMECLFDPAKPHLAAWLWICNKYSYRRSPRSMATMSPEKPEASPLFYAVQFGFRDLTAHLLAEHPEHVLSKGGWYVTVLHASAVRRHIDVDIFSLLLDHLPNPDIRGVYDETALHRLSHWGHLEAGQQLLDHGADVNACDKDNWTPLYVAAANGRLEFVRMLLEHGAAINTPAITGHTPLRRAIEEGHVEVVLLLLEHGADPNVRDNYGMTLSDYSRNGKGKMVELLSEYGTKSIKQ
jgi:ankyrin repeat protein